MALIRMLLNILNEEEEEAAMNENAALMKTLRDTFSAFYLTDYQFVNVFRLSKEAVHYLCCVLQPSLQRYRSNGLSVQTQVFAALRFLAIGSYQKGIGNDYLVQSISQSAISRAINQWQQELLNFWLMNGFSSQQQKNNEQH